MRTPILLMLLAAPVGALAQSTAMVRWDVTTTFVDLAIPGAPGFLLKMAKGRSRVEHKCLAAGQAVAAVLAPDPKAECRIDNQQIASGRYAQSLTCPQRRGAPLRVTRSGNFDDSGFSGRAEMTGQTPKGMMRVTMNQRAARVAGKCRA